MQILAILMFDFILGISFVTASKILFIVFSGFSSIFIVSLLNQKILYKVSDKKFCNFKKQKFNIFKHIYFINYNGFDNINSNGLYII